MTTKLTGRVVSGVGQGARFTQLDWARAQFIQQLDIDPFPGTLNLILETSDALDTWQAWKTSPGIEIVPPHAEGCRARAYPIRLAGRVQGAIVLPQVESYAPSQIEIIAAVSLRDTLHLNDGDALAIELLTGATANARDTALGYLRAHNVMTLATHGPEGLWAAAVFYVSADFALYFLSAPTSRHSLNLAAQAHAAVTIQQEYADWRAIKGLQMEGTVARLDGLEQARAILLYGKKFPLVADLARAPEAIVRAFARVAWYRFTPTRVYFVDNAQGFGHRDEIALDAERAANG